MAMKIISQKEQPLLSRTEVKAHISFEAETTSNEAVAKEIAKQTKKDEKLIVVKRISTHFGSKEADVEALVYDSAEAKETIERKTKAMKEAEAKAAEEAAKPAEEAKPEAPKEEAKEEPKAEEKPAEEKKEEAPAEKAEEKKEE